MTLFRPKAQSSKHLTTFAYELGHFPRNQLSDTHKKLLFWHRTQRMDKSLFVRRLSEDLTEFFWADDPRPFKIHWLYGAVPTELEWESLPNDTMIFVDLRISPVFEGSGRIALLFTSRAHTRMAS